jgi:hypothetical protein
LPVIYPASSQPGYLLNEARLVSEGITINKLKNIAVIVFAATSLFTLSACGEFIKEFKKEIGVGAEAETLTFYNGQFTAHKPDGWTILDDLNDQAEAATFVKPTP